MYKALPTNIFLSRCGIIPTNATTYTLKDMETCLTGATGGFVPHLGCNSEGYLNEVWYYFHLRGKAGNAEVGEYGFEGTNSTFPSTCPTDGIKYPPKLRQEEALWNDEILKTSDELWRFREQTMGMTW
jgi:ribonuclease T2